MADDQGGSAVARAVVQLAESLSRARESEVHADEGSALVRLMIRHLDLAAEDEAQPIAEAERLAATASESLLRASRALSAGGDAVRQYVAKIAPGHSLPGMDGATKAPPGEHLVEARRPRSLRGVIRVSTKEAGDLSDAATAMHDVFEGLAQLRVDPDLSHPGTISPASGPEYSPDPPGHASNDPFAAITLTAVVAIEVGRRMFSSFRRKVMKRKVDP